MSKIISWLDSNWYKGFSNNWDDLLFRNKILQHIQSSSEILDLGAGAGIVSHMNFKGLASRVCGVDLDPRVVDNPFLDEGRISDAGEIPYGSACFDLVFSDNVFEHLDHPEVVFREVSRVLKPGGLFLFKTPNKWHYMPTIARFTPHAFHQFVNRLRGRDSVDTFPTRYRANTKNDIDKLASLTGFVVESLDRIEGRPEYLRITWPTYLIGAGYERLVNSTSKLEPFRIVIIGVLKKHDTGSSI